MASPKRIKEIQAVEAPRDVLLASASFESRSVAAIESLPGATRYRVGLLYANEEFMPKGQKDATGPILDRLNELLTEKCDQVCFKVGSWLDPAKQLMALQELMGNLCVDGKKEAVSTVDVDITTFTRESLMVCLALLRRRFPSCHCRCLYSVPKNHGDWLSRGYRCVRNVMGFSGIQIPGARTVLVILTGFEADRAMKLIEEHEPSQILLGIGDPPTNRQFLERNLEQHKAVLARQEVSEFRFPTSGIRACVEALTQTLGPYLGECNVIMAPMSTKLSTVAAMLVAESDPRIQVTYCLPGEYNTESYSSGADRVLVEELC